MLPTATTGAQVGPSTISLQSILLSSTGHGWPFSQARHRRISIRSTSLTTISATQINVTASNDCGQTSAPSVDVLAQNGMAATQSCLHYRRQLECVRSA